MVVVTSVPRQAAARQLDSARGSRFPWSIFWIALLVRLAAMTFGHYYRFSSIEDHFKFGWEMGRIARSLATGHGYANPFDHPSGPTGWVTPLYPLILAGIFKVFGVYSALSAWVILAFNCVCSSLMVWTTWEIAVRCFNRRVAWWSAWIWALYPAAMQFAVRWVWEMTLTAFLFQCILLLALRMRNIGGDAAQAGETATTKRWALSGLLWGLATLSSASIAIFLPFSGIWILLGARDWKRQLPRVALASVLCLGCIAPWTIRNALVFHKFIPMRTNFGAELWMGNDPNLHGMLVGSPTALPEQEQLYDRMGEIAYVRSRAELAKKEILGAPGTFVGMTLMRVYYFWADVPHGQQADQWWTEYVRNFNFQFTSVAGILGLILALRRRIPGATLFAWAFVTVPFLYYFVIVEARFRHPLEPLIDILAVYLFQSAEKSWRIRGIGR
jgi:4-amino-4-deoxy-L-arabinose transferase-like glycosyltransferase